MTRQNRQEDRRETLRSGIVRNVTSERHMRSVFQQRYHPIVPVILIPLMMLFTACSSHYLKDQINPHPPSDYSDGALDFVHMGGSIKASIFVEIADTRETQIKGLMGRSDLNINKGMLFIFKQLKPRKFWMKNTLISLDIIFIGRDGCIVNIAESTTPMSNQIYRSNGPIKYVVEVRAGFVKRFKIDSSTCIRWRRL